MIPDTFPSCFLDRAFYALSHVGEMVIQLEARFLHPLDAERLERSLQRVMDAEPILGCRFDPSGALGCWRRLPEEDRSGLIVTDDPDAFDELRVTPLDVERGPALRVGLLSEPGSARLLLSVAHHVADAGAVKRVASLLSSVYTRLRTEPGFRPRPRLDGERGIAQVTRTLPWTSVFPISWALVKEGLAQNLGRPCQTLPLQGVAGEGLRHITRRIDEGQVARLVEYGRSSSATLNDLALCAGFRALAEVAGWTGDTKLSLNMTVDLRRHLPEGDTPGICNLSGIEAITLGRGLEESFDATLKRVVAKTRARKRGWIGLNVYGSPMAKTLQGMSLRDYAKAFRERYDAMTRKGRVAPTLTNAGALPPLDLDGPAETCHLLIPPMYPPAASVGLSGYRGSLTLSTAAYGPDHAPMERLLDGMLFELESAVAGQGSGLF